VRVIHPGTDQFSRVFKGIGTGVKLLFGKVCRYVAALPVGVMPGLPDLNDRVIKPKRLAVQVAVIPRLKVEHTVFDRGVVVFAVLSIFRDQVNDPYRLVRRFCPGFRQCDPK
jgi:hypothetical protein